MYINIRNSYAPFICILWNNHPIFTSHVMWITERKASSVLGQ